MGIIFILALVAWSLISIFSLPVYIFADKSKLTIFAKMVIITAMFPGFAAWGATWIFLHIRYRRNMRKINSVIRKIDRIYYVRK